MGFLGTGCVRLVPLFGLKPCLYLNQVFISWSIRVVTLDVLGAAKGECMIVYADISMHLCVCVCVVEMSICVFCLLVVVVVVVVNRGVLRCLHLRSRQSAGR